jgi:hypothetical protein
MKSHEFHFIAGEKIFITIEKISKEMDRSFSATIIIIYLYLIPFFEKNHLMAQEKESNIELVGSDDEIRRHIHCYLPKDLYRKLKLFHQDMNTYSMAQIIRKMMQYFIIGYNKYGLNGFLERLKKVKDVWDGMKNKFITSNKIFKKRNNNKNSKYAFLNTIYTDYYSPNSFQLIKMIL